MVSSVESFSDKWVASDGNSFYYDINSTEDSVIDKTDSNEKI